MAILSNSISIVRDSYNRPGKISIASGETKYSDRIDVDSDRDFAIVGFKISRTGSLKIDVYVQYSLPKYENDYTSGVLLGSNNDAGDSIVVFRLDAILGPNWIPNLPMRFKFVASGGGSGTIEGIYSV